MSVGQNSKNVKKVLDRETCNSSILELLLKADEVRKRAYCPYSRFSVGAAVRTSTGEIFIGCNIENSCFSPSICAERAAISQAVSAGYRDIVECAVVAYLPDSFVYPCGVCRQTLAEFTDITKDMQIYLSKSKVTAGEIIHTTISELLAGIGRLAFSEESLERPEN